MAKKPIIFEVTGDPWLGFFWTAREKNSGEDYCEGHRGYARKDGAKRRLRRFIEKINTGDYVIEK